MVPSYISGMRLLVVEDERRLAERLGAGLREEGFAVDVAANLGNARDRAIESEYDVIVLDLKLPDGSGLDLLKEWRNEKLATPIIALTALDRLEDKIAGLDAGADDYLAKPFEFDELLARIRALLRRRATPPRDVLEFGALRLDRTARQAQRAGQVLDLTPKEFALLEYFLLHPGVAVSRQALAEHVWDAQFEARSNVIDVLVGRLRRKVDPSNQHHLKAVPGIGWALRDGSGEDS